ncbi:MAG: gp257 [uncultured marine phage]|uniref:Gp257 n=1 Tax=uncultured marine phage TaxID=707152 RepID=A0A8D9C902_9VIRU|nr:MAG: gp257 [uncultured marine phage]
MYDYNTMDRSYGSKLDFNKFAMDKGVKESYIKNYSTQIVNSDGTIMDIYSKMLNERIIFLTSEVDNYTSNMIKSQLLYLNTVSDDDISIYIDSPGGSVYTGLGILDVMDFVECDVQTVNIGLAASMAAVILAYGKDGKRKTLKRSRTMIHQPLGYSGYAQASDIEIDAKQIMSVKEELLQVLADSTNQTYEKIKEDSDRDYWMNGKQAKSYGIVDIIL